MQEGWLNRQLAETGLSLRKEDKGPRKMANLEGPRANNRTQRNQTQRNPRNQDAKQKMLKDPNPVQERALKDECIS